MIEKIKRFRRRVSYFFSRISYFFSRIIAWVDWLECLVPQPAVLVVLSVTHCCSCGVFLLH